MPPDSGVQPKRAGFVFSRTRVLIQSTHQSDKGQRKKGPCTNCSEKKKRMITQNEQICSERMVSERYTILFSVLLKLPSVGMTPSVFDPTSGKSGTCQKTSGLTVRHESHQEEWSRSGEHEYIWDIFRYSPVSSTDSLGYDDVTGRNGFIT